MTITQLDESFRLPFLSEKKTNKKKNLVRSKSFSWCALHEQSHSVERVAGKKGIQEMMHKKVVETKQKQKKIPGIARMLF